MSVLFHLYLCGRYAAEWLIDMKKLEAAIYCRVDAGGNPENRKFVLELQRSKLLDYAKRNNFEIVGEYFDNGFSGFDMNRAGLKDLIAAGERGTFSFVLVVNRDKLFRDRTLFEKQSLPFHVRSLNELEHDLNR